MSFVHLHCHSEYSLLDGANRIDDLIARAKLFEQPALAITDHGNMHAAWEFQEKARKAGIKPILGMEAYVAPGDRRARGRAAPGTRAYYHLVLLARDLEGYKNLVKLSSLGFTEGFYGKPRIDRELLAKHSNGIIVSSACMAGEVASHLLDGREAEAREAAEWYANVFGDRYHLEVQAHNSDGQQALNSKIFTLADSMGLPVVATNDAHFLKHEDHDAHDVLLCIGLGKDRNDRDRMKYDDGLYFKSAPEMLSVFPDRPDVLENTLKIADAVDVQFSKKYNVPSFPLPPEVNTENDLLVKLATEGAVVRYGSPLSDEVQERLRYELDVITKTGYAGYFLIVWDFIRAARDLGIPVGPGRGSAAGSLVAYALKITDVCPLEFDLLFERFLNPERVSMPDVDVDFCFERRGEVIEYVRQKYGKDSVGQIVTFGTMKSRAAIKDVGRTLGFTPKETDELAKLIPNAPNNSLTVKEAVKQVPDVKNFYQQNVRYKQLLDYAIALEGLSRHTGVHAAGVVIAPGPLDEFVPVCTQASKGSGAGEDERVIVTQYDMNALEKAGMLKMDFLGLTTLTIITDTLKLVKERTGTDIVLEERGFTDPDTYRLLRAGRTGGVFQFESPLATDVLKRMRCDRFDDLVASNALLRPGPLDAGMHNVYIKRKRGEEEVTYDLPELETILTNTYGVITYQEQVMRIAQTLAGISLAEADVLRKAVGKKDAELIKKELGKFSEKAIAKGHDKKIIEKIAGQIETFGRYGFNKSHSVAYSVLSYHTAWLKTHHPAEFMAALLSSQIGKTEEVIKYINEARELQIQVLAPDVNESDWRFNVVADKRIRFGLGAVRNVGRSAVDSMLEARREGGAFTSLYDMCSRVDLRVCNKRVFEALIAAGACDSLGGHRAQLLQALDAAINEASLQQEEAEKGQGSLFGDLMGTPDDSGFKTPTAPTLPNVAEWSESERLQREKELIGFYISGHPLEPFRTECELFASHTVSKLGEYTSDPVSLGVVVTSIKRQFAKSSGAEYARLTVEDFTGSSEVLVFPEAWSVMSDRIRPDVPMLLKGGYKGRGQDGDDATFIVQSVTRFAEIRASGELGVSIDLGSDSDLVPSIMEDVRVTIEQHPGSAPLEFRWADNGGKPIRFRSKTLTIAASPVILSDLRALLGADRVRLVRAG
jgi:DNA polymerase-3 subunit alpha